MTNVIDDPKAFGLRVKAAREEAGLTQPELAQAVGRHVNTISRLEQGRTPRPPKHLLTGIARVLGVSVDRLLSLPAEAQSAPIPDEHPSALSPDDDRILRAFRGNLRAGRDYVIQADRMAAYDQRLFLEAMEWAIRLIESGGDWQQRRQDRAEGNPANVVNHVGA